SRNIALGPLTRTASASSSGSNMSAALTAGYDLRLGRFTVGPTVGVTTQNVTVNAFDESNAASSNLHIADQSRKSEVWSAGLRARAPNVNAQSLAGALPIEASLPQVWVDRPDDATRARDLIDAFLRAPAGAPFTCPACGEENPAGFELCWSCKAPLVHS